MAELFSGLIGSGSIGGSSAKRDRSEQLDAFTGLRNVFNWAIPTGKKIASSGIQDVGAAGNYFRNLVSGNRAQMNQAAAPEIASATAASDASKRNLAASGTARGGGVAGTNQQENDKLQAQIDNAMFGIRPGAAQQAGALGTQEQLAGAQYGFLGERGATDLGNISTYSRGLSDKLHKEATNNIANAIDSTISDIIGGASGGGGVLGGILGGLTGGEYSG